MIHTAQFYILLTDEEISEIGNRFEKDPTQVSHEMDKQCTKVLQRASLKVGVNGGYLLLLIL